MIRAPIWAMSAAAKSSHCLPFAWMVEPHV
jgi:hypothetical protein